MQTPRRRQAGRNRKDAESAIAPPLEAAQAAAYLEPAAVQSRMIKIADYAPHPRNYNRHPPAQVQAIAASLRTFGQPRPVAVWRNYYLAGHGVIEAAKSLGWTEARADVLPNDYPEHLALAYVAADNELARLSDPDEAALAAILTESRESDPALLAAIGYSAAELDALIARVEAGRKGQVTGDPEPKLEAAEELRQEWQTAPGQLWTLGAHRLLCADCTKPAAWDRLMRRERADLLWTDPPYGVDYAGINQYLNSYDAGNRIETAIRHDARPREEMIRFWLEAYQHAAQHSRPGAAFYSAAPSGDLFDALIHSIRSAGWTIRQQIIWIKNRQSLGLSDYHWKHEPLIYGWKPGAGHTWTDESHATTVIDDETDPRTLDKPALIAMVDGLRNAARSTAIRVNAPTANDQHPTSKPTQLIRLTATNNTEAGALWIDPFAGSGSTLIAAEQAGRRCYAMELDAGYCAVILQRYQEATGDRPTLEEAGA